MRYSKIKKYDISNGWGIRTSLFVTGCHFHCPGCFNSELWDFKSGKEFDEDARTKLFKLLEDEHCKGLSILGGEPLDQGEEMLKLVKEVKTKFPDKDIWLWSGYRFEDLSHDQKEIVLLCNYFVDGQFIKEQSEEHYLFRGSKNQRIWKISKSPEILIGE